MEKYKPLEEDVFISEVIYIAYIFLCFMLFYQYACMTMYSCIHVRYVITIFLGGRYLDESVVRFIFHIWFQLTQWRGSFVLVRYMIRPQWRSDCGTFYGDWSSDRWRLKGKLPTAIEFNVTALKLTHKGEPTWTKCNHQISLIWVIPELFQPIPTIPGLISPVLTMNLCLELC